VCCRGTIIKRGCNLFLFLFVAECNAEALESMGNRLLDWFSVVMADTQKRKSIRKNRITQGMLLYICIFFQPTTPLPFLETLKHITYYRRILLHDSLYWDEFSDTTQLQREHTCLMFAFNEMACIACSSILNSS